MTCPLPTPEARRHQVAERINRATRAERIVLRARIYAEVPAESRAEEMGREPKARCVICWEKRPNRLRWKEHKERHRYTCDDRSCYLLWFRLTRAEERAHAEAQARLVESVQEGRAA